jgi:hypothetical protein
MHWHLSEAGLIDKWGWVIPPTNHVDYLPIMPLAEDDCE